MPSTTSYTLSLHDALPICGRDAGKGAEILREGLGDAARVVDAHRHAAQRGEREAHRHAVVVVRIDHRGLQLPRGNPQAIPSLLDRKSTRLNSSHTVISYAVHDELHSFPTRRSSDLRPRCWQRR